MVSCKSTAEEVSFEWSHHRILSTDSKVKTTLHVSIIDSGNEKVNPLLPNIKIEILLSFPYTFLIAILGEVILGDHILNSHTSLSYSLLLSSIKVLTGVLFIPP